MKSPRSRANLDQTIRARAGDACEYCRFPQVAFRLRFPIDHVIARQHGGKTIASNLALACVQCNLRKGPNIAGIDPFRKQIVPLFHPRRDHWDAHFRLRGARIIGVSPIGRATIRVLGINEPDSLALRRSLISEGLYPPRLAQRRSK